MSTSYGTTSAAKMTLEQAALRMFRAGQSKWPLVSLDFQAFLAHCQRVLGPDDELPLEPEALYLCCACGLAQPEALRLFESEGSDVARAAIRRVDRREEFVNETLQELWSKLLVGADAKVRSYSGRGPLNAWLRVTATHVALDRVRENNRHARREAPLSERLAVVVPSVEGSLLKARFGGAFEGALRESVAALSKRDRNVLRMHVVGRCSIDEIGRAYGVHRATAARWIERARSKIHADVRCFMEARHGVTASEFRSLAALMGPELQLSLSRLSPPEPEAPEPS